ncbi:MAG TPA: hypothetical protein VD907_03290 [Verrucomicrobiae bacterium]|nr:hypothetical protein [Verrucomicrobiae bacterium]
MKDIDTLLERGKAPSPRRALSKDFTANVIAGIATKPEKRSWWQTLQGAFRMKLMQKPMMLVTAIAAVITLSGTAYALTNWPAISTMISGQKELKSGNRVVKVEAENCEYTKSINGDPHNKVAYYEVKKDSKLSNEQVVAMIQGICEENVMNKIVNEQSKNLHEALKGTKSVTSTRLMQVQAINDTSITLKTDPKYSDQRTITYQLAPSLKAFNYDAPSSLESIKAGDTVSVVLSDSRNISTEKQGYTEDLNTIAVEVIVELKPLTGNPDTFYHNLGTEFVRVEPSKDGEGFTRVYDFHK